MIMGTLSMTAIDSHTKYHWPPERCSDLLCDIGRAPLGRTNGAGKLLPKSVLWVSLGSLYREKWQTDLSTDLSE